MVPHSFETGSLRMEPKLLVSFHAPLQDVDRIMSEVVRLTPLAMGNYDSNAYQSAEGFERYRPLKGAAAGPETDLRKRPGVVEISFELDDDGELLEQVVEAIFQAHSYEEPVIRVATVLTSRSKGLDDSANPNRWWNTTGDWARTSGSSADQG
ncbi:MAG: hypothetical protein K5872_21680 [Rhizobiaceae bacterium]|nr:hypothetical protein [Rhizobiaceae bacterium]MCV0408830.1 hypothetical protein [Rhizobiaceae bacterium]